jgi:hypothetical protein
MVSVSVGLDPAGPPGLEGSPCPRDRCLWLPRVASGQPAVGFGRRSPCGEPAPWVRAEGPAWHVADLTSYRACLELVGTIAQDVVFHLASAVTGARDVDLVVSVVAAKQSTAVNLLGVVMKFAAPPAEMVMAGSIEEPHQGGDLTPHSPYAAAELAPATAEELLEWRPSISLEDAIRETVAWYTEKAWPRLLAFGARGMG